MANVIRQGITYCGLCCFGLSPPGKIMVVPWSTGVFRSTGVDGRTDGPRTIPVSIDSKNLNRFSFDRYKLLVVTMKNGIIQTRQCYIKCCNNCC